jgi:DNA-directed RNA polymerase subunit RPC12/RpoP
VAGVPTWLNVLIAVFIGYAIWKIGIATVRSASGGHATGDQPEPEPEDVEDLDVFFVCAECGTEFRVTRLGQTQVPRHCGEKMQVVRRPAAEA